MHWGLLLMVAGLGAFYALRLKDEPRTAWQFTRTPLAWALLVNVLGVGWHGDLALVVVLALYLVLPLGLVAFLVGRFALGLPWFRTRSKATSPDSLLPDDGSAVVRDPVFTTAAFSARAKSALKRLAAPRHAWVAGGVAASLACAAGAWWYLTPRDPDFSGYEACLLQHLIAIPSSSVTQYQSTLWQIRGSCSRLHPVELDIEVLARARPGWKHWDEKVSEVLVDSFLDGWSESFSAEDLRDAYFKLVILPRIHPDWESEVRALWNIRAKPDVDELNRALLRSRESGPQS